MAELDNSLNSRTQVRRAAVADIPDIVLIGKRFFDESGYAKRGVQSSPFKLHQSIENFIAADHAAVFVADRCGELVGVGGVTSFAMYFSDDPMAMELFWWMAPGARNSRAAIGLLDAIEHWAVEQGCVAVCMVDLPGIESSAPHIYQRRGYELAERFWIRRIK